ncbi:MAG: DUF554 domain-containing protein [Tannerellaceae bacterium]|jgi:uncharacterized membrane protein YqgA involved in biofilm formation|nr:DUF554 domain-containing protein [Tannerellaceae bacterium]
MIGTLVNTGAVAIGGLIGLTIRKGLKEKYRRIYFQAVGLFTLLLGAKMAIDMGSPLVIVISLVLGGFAGAGMRLDELAGRLGVYVKKKMPSEGDRFMEGLLTAFLLFCVGSMTIVGAIEEGLGKTSDLLLTKSIMDFFSSIMLASGLGLGVVFSAALVLIFQGGITMLVSIAGQGLPDEVVGGVSATGGIIMIGLALQLLDIKKMEIINLLPALILVCLFTWLEMRFF